MVCVHVGIEEVSLDYKMDEIIPGSGLPVKTDLHLRLSAQHNQES